MTYEQTLSFLYEQLPMFHRIGPAAYKPGLDNTHALLKLVGNPETSLKCVHVAGTNGKGSTSHLIASVLQEAGYKTGLYTSPHLKDFRERIRINGAMIPKEEVIDFVELYKDKWQEIAPSFFEITVALCFRYFLKKNVDIAVIETGLGGRLDSTNVVTPEVSVITNIGMDHMNLLGDTIEKIAFEKAGIIKQNCPVVIGTMRLEAENITRAKAKEMDAPIFFANEMDVVPDSTLNVIYQEQNKRTALCAIRVLQNAGDWNISESAINRGYQNVVSNTGLAGRWQILQQNPLVIADVAHNEDGINMVLQQLASMKFNRLHFVLGMVSDKDISKVLSLLPSNAIYYFCKADIPRGMDAEELKNQASEFGLQGQTFDSVISAYGAALMASNEDDLVLVSGSIFTVAEVL